MKSLRLHLCALFALTIPVTAEIIGVEQFDYPDGPIARKKGGTFWNYKNTSPPSRSAGPSEWKDVAEASRVASRRLVTSVKGAVRRKYEAYSQDDGAVNDATVAKTVYYRVDVTTGPSVTAEDYFGISSMEFETEKIYCGKRGGSTTWGVDEVGVAGGGTDGSLIIQPDKTYTLVVQLDFMEDWIRLYVDPDLSAAQGADVNAKAQTASRTYPGNASSTAVCLSSGTEVRWDNLVVATTWEELGITLVNTTADEDDSDLGGGAGISLREAVKYSPADTRITFAPSLSGQSITLTHSDGDMRIDRTLTIDATALPGGLTVNGNDTSRHFFVASGKTLTLRGLTLTGGNGRDPAYGVRGGAIHNAGTLTLTQCTLSGNSANGGGGGAIANTRGTLTLTKCTLSGNSANYGGAIFNQSGKLTLTQCTLSGNSASGGGALSLSEGTPILTQCTLSGNSALNLGGAIDNEGPLTLNNCIVAGNAAPNGPDLYHSGATGTVAVTSTGMNVIGNPADSSLMAGTTVIVGDPKLAPFGYYGGPTKTMLPLSGSPAILPGSVTHTDQRGFTVKGRPTIGAVMQGEVITVTE